MKLLRLENSEAEFLAQWIQLTIQEGYRIAKDLPGYKASNLVVGRDLTSGNDKDFLKDLSANMLRLAAIGERLQPVGNGNG